MYMSFIGIVLSVVAHEDHIYLTVADRVQWHDHVDDDVQSLAPSAF